MTEELTMCLVRHEMTVVLERKQYIVCMVQSDGQRYNVQFGVCGDTCADAVLYRSACLLVKPICLLG